MTVLSQILRTFQKNRIDFLIFFVTTRCNSRCGHCFFWKSLNQKDELSLEEIKKIFSNLGYIRDISLSGGEPILREDISDIIKIICEKSKPYSLSIPSNGLLPRRLEQVAKKMMKEHPKTKLILNLSVDGLERTHEYIRGVKGNFKKVLECMDRLNKIKKEYRNLTINVNTVLINKNIEEIPRLMKFVKSKMGVDGHYFEVMRGDSKDKNFKIPNIKKLAAFYKKAVENNKYYFNKKYSQNKIEIKLGKKFTEFFYSGIVKYLYKIQMDVLLGKKFPFCCLAGKTSLVIYPNGNVSVCELRQPIENIRNFDYDFNKLKQTQKFINLLKEIKRTRCSCTHDCFIYNTLNHNPWHRLIALPINFLKK
jgi:MoaA/NifB/PqqE/SkfB family radical SAM enzyme